MNARYAYSFDRDSFTGHFPTRQEALTEALKQAADLPGAPTSVYVGRWKKTDPQASDHAQTLIDAMILRADGLPGMQHFLKDITDAQIADLDTDLQRTLLAWMTRHHLLPQTESIENVTEHPLPVVPSTPEVRTQNEVVELGTTDYPLET